MGTRSFSRCRRIGAGAATAIALGAALSSCVQVPDAQSTGPFQAGRWESDDGVYYLELFEDGDHARGVLPLLPSRSLTSLCDGGAWPEATEVDAKWWLDVSSDGSSTIVLEYDSEPMVYYGIGFIEPGNWAVLEHYPCGVDSWPPLWLVRVGEE